MDLKIEISHEKLGGSNPIKRKDRLIMIEKKQNKNKHFNFRVNEKKYNKIKSKIEKSKLNIY